MQQNVAYMYNLYGQKDLHKLNVTSTAKCKLQMNEEEKLAAEQIQVRINVQSKVSMHVLSL
jgi:hypothetical protein